MSSKLELTQSNRNVSIGKAYPATFYYVLKEAMQELQHKNVYKNITVATSCLE
jgi:hypothetical protein